MAEPFQNVGGAGRGTADPREISCPAVLLLVLWVLPRPLATRQQSNARRAKDFVECSSEGAGHLSKSLGHRTKKKMDTDANGTVLEVDEVTPCMRDASQPSDAGDELRRLAASLQSDDESRAIVKGMAASADRLRSMGTVHPLHPVVEYFLEFGRHLVEGQESIAANSAVLELSAPQHRDELQKLTVTVRHCVNGLVNNADTAKRCYAELDKAAAKALDDPKADVPALFRRIRQVTRQADLVIGQSIGQSEATLAAIRVFQNNNRVYQVGYRAVLHGILLFVAVGVVAAKIAAKELQSYEFVVITVGFVMYVVLEHSWWAYTTHKIAMAQRSIKKQANAMKALQKKIQELASKKQ